MCRTFRQICNYEDFLVAITCCFFQANSYESEFPCSNGKRRYVKNHMSLECNRKGGAMSKLRNIISCGLNPKPEESKKYLNDAVDKVRKEELKRAREEKNSELITSCLRFISIVDFSTLGFQLKYGRGNFFS